MKKERKLFKTFKLIVRNLTSLHHMVWGKGINKFIIAVVITLAVFLILMTITLEVTSTPKFCNICHNMKPYYNSWLNSSHKDVTCTDCHFPPGFKSKIKGKFTALSMVMNYFTGVYKRSKPWAEISDKSCMRSGCHETRMLSGKVDFKKNIIFDHEPHLKELRRGKKLRCTSCHSQIVQGSHISVTETTCFLCHFKEIVSEADMSKCTNCHSPPTSNIVDDATVIYDHKLVIQKKIKCQKCHGTMVIGDGSVPKTRCGNCHADIEKIKLYADTTLMHKNHITDHKIECEQCHTEIQHKSVARTDSIKPDCHACHPDYHNAQLQLLLGKGGKGLPDHPSPMYEAGLNCQACHIYHESPDKFIEKGETLLAGAASCEPCHGKGYNRILANWEVQTKRKISQLTKILAFAEKIIENKKKHKEYNRARQKLDDALYNYKLVKHGKSIHNIAFANKLMQKAFQFTEESMKDIDSKKKLPYFEQETGIVPGECSNCHAGIERKVKTAFGWTFSHFIHLKGQGLSCSHCHSNERIHGQLIIAKQDCMNCHHKGLREEREPACNSCHEVQNSIYFSRLDFSTFKIPNIMVDDVACLDCHRDDDGNLLRPGKSICTNCHEKDYEDMFDEWKTSSLELLEKLKEKVKNNKLRKGNHAYDILELLEKDGSNGIHNPELYAKLVEEALR